jgi:thymidylate kinase
MHEPQRALRTQLESIQEEVREIAEVLLREHPSGTPMSAVWEEALLLHRVRYETEILPPPHAP